MTPQPIDLTPVRQPANFDRSVDRIDSPPPGGGGQFTHPFQIQDASTSSAAKVNVRYGTLMDLIPTNVGTDISITDGTHTFYLEVTLDEAGNVTAVSLLNTTDGQPANVDDVGDHTSLVYITIGEVIVTTVEGIVKVEIHQAATHSLRFRACNRVVEDLESTPPVAFAPGTYHFWGF